MITAQAKIVVIIDVDDKKYSEKDQYCERMPLSDTCNGYYER